MVIGLNLCPFARRVFEADAIPYAVSNARDGERSPWRNRTLSYGIASCTARRTRKPPC